MDQTLQEAHPSQICLLSWTNRFLLLFKAVWAVFSVITIKTTHPPDTYVGLDSVLQAQEQGGTVWSEKILSWLRWCVTTSLGFNPLSWGGKVGQVHLIAWSKGMTSQSFSNCMAERMLRVLENDPLGAPRAGLLEPSQVGQGVLFLELLGLLGSLGRHQEDPETLNLYGEFTVCTFSL